MKNVNRFLFLFLLLASCTITSKNREELFNDFKEKGKERYKNGKYEKAIEYFASALKIFPNDNETLRLLSSSYHSIGDYNKELEILKSAIGYYPKDGILLHNQGMAKYELKQHQAALEDLLNAQKLNPNFPELYNSLGLCYQSVYGYKKDYLGYFDKAIELNPEFFAAYNNRGFLKMQLGSFKSAVQDFDKAIAISNNYLLAYYNRACTYILYEKPSQAITDLDKIIAINPNYKGVYFVRANAKGNLGDEQGMCDDLKEAIKKQDEGALEAFKGYCSK